jgi:hypothetical protein
LREAGVRGIAVTDLRISAEGDFGGDPITSTGITYSIDLAGDAPEDDLRRLVADCEAGAAIPHTLRQGNRRPSRQGPGSRPSLTDQDGLARRLSELQGANPMVLHLSRGGFDPKEDRFVRHLVDAHHDFRVAYTRVAVISTDTQLELNEFRDTATGLEPADGARSIGPMRP